MVFLFGVPLADTLLVKKALQTFYGIGPNISARLCAKLSIHPTARVSSLQAPKVVALQTELQKMTLDNDLRGELRENLTRLKDLGTYRGRRHAQGLPVRGQRTKKQVACARRLNRLDRWG